MNTCFVIYVIVYIIISVWIDLSELVPKKVFTVKAEDDRTAIIVKRAITERIALEKEIGFSFPQETHKQQNSSESIPKPTKGNGCRMSLSE